MTAVKFLLLPRWVRRLVVIPAFVVAVVWVFGLLPVWLLVATCASRFVPGRWRVLRLVWFLVVYLAMELVVLVSLFGLSPGGLH